MSQSFVMVNERLMRMVPDETKSPGTKKSEWYSNETWICVEYVALVRNVTIWQSKDEDQRCEILMEIGEQPVSVFVSETVEEIMALVRGAQEDPSAERWRQISAGWPGRSVVVPSGPTVEHRPRGVVVPSDIPAGMRAEVVKDIIDYRGLGLPNADEAITAFNAVVASAGKPPAEIISKWRPGELGDCANCGEPKVKHCTSHPGEPCCPGNMEDACQLSPEGAVPMVEMLPHDDDCEMDFICEYGLAGPCRCGERAEARKLIAEADEAASALGEHFDGYVGGEEL